MRTLVIVSLMTVLNILFVYAFLLSPELYPRRRAISISVIGGVLLTGVLVVLLCIGGWCPE